MNRVHHFTPNVLDIVIERLEVIYVSQESRTDCKEYDATLDPLVQNSHQKAKSKSIENSRNHIARLIFLWLKLVNIFAKLLFFSNCLSQYHKNRHGKSDQHTYNRK